MTGGVLRLTRVWRSPAATYVGAVGVRTAARAAWGLAVPTALSVAAYGHYQVIATAAAMVAQLALLGTPQTIVRYAGRRLPMRLLMLHAVVLAGIAISVAVILVPSTRGSAETAVLAGLALATIAATLFGARAKAAFAFATSFGSELAGAAVLAAGAVLVIVAHAFTATPATALIVEASAVAATAVMLAVGTARRRSATPNVSPTPPLRTLAHDVYAVGALVLLDVVLFRRLELYFLERSPDGLAGAGVLGLALQIAAVALLVPTALLEAWQPSFAVGRHTGGDAAFRAEITRRGRQFAPLALAVAIAGTALPLVAIPLLFPQYRPWLWYIVGFVAIRLVCAGAGFFSSALYAVGRHRALYAPAVIGGIVAVTANATLTREAGLRGALVAYALTQVTVAVLTVVAFARSTARARAAVTPDAVPSTEPIR